jgi:hypothetical protein
MGYNFVQAQAVAAAADAADAVAVEVAILAANSMTDGQTKTMDLFQNDDKDSKSSREYHRKITNDAEDNSVSNSGTFSTGSPMSNSSSEESIQIKTAQTPVEEAAWTCSYCQHVHSTFKFRCANCTGYNMGSGGRASASSNTESPHISDDNFDHSEDDSSLEDEVEPSWDCGRCKHREEQSLSRCSNCKGWRDGKRPKADSGSKADQFIKAHSKDENGGMKHTSPSSDDEFEFSMPKDEASVHLKSSKAAKKLPPHLSSTPKKDLKPLFEINDRVFAPWWEDVRRKSQPSWYAGVITNYLTIGHSPYGPVRQYDVLFDDDGEELADIEDSFVFSREDYLLSTSDKEWIGVKNVLDDQSGDSWAEVVGWYEATIGESFLLPSLSLFRLEITPLIDICLFDLKTPSNFNWPLTSLGDVDGATYAFSRLSDALRAYDEHVIVKKGDAVNPSELNLPDEIIRENTESR